MSEGASETAGSGRKAGSERRGRAPAIGLSAKLLVLTGLFVMFAEVLIFVPSVANFQRGWLEDRLRTANVAALALMSDDTEAPQELQSALLARMEASAIVVRGGGVSRLVAMAETPQTVTRTLDLRRTGFAASIPPALASLFGGGEGSVRVLGDFAGGTEPATIELVVPERVLRAAIFAYAGRIVVLSLVMSLITAGLVYASLQRLFVAPMKRLVAAVERFGSDPEGASAVPPSPRRDEFGAAERRLAAVNRQLSDTLRQQRRLADLGLAVSKINHDLRNLLASAQLFSDRISRLPDPTVQRFAPKLVAALDRAVDYCQAVLNYGRTREAAPKRRLVALRRLVDDVAEMAGLDGNRAIDWTNAVPADLEIDADADQFYRVLTNLVRNAVQALEARPEDMFVRRLTVEASRHGGVVDVRVSDTGPGVPPERREALFRPFAASQKPGGTGLGLAIAAEIVRAHGGTIALVGEGPGATFRIEIPDRPIDIEAARRRPKAG